MSMVVVFRFGSDKASIRVQRCEQEVAEVSQKLSVFLIKEDVIDPCKIVRGELVKYSFPLRDDLPFSGQAYFGTNPSNSPDWLPFLQDGISARLPDVANRSTRAVLLVRFHERYFAFTFGYGRSLLDPNVYVRDFGVKCVLNTVNPGTLVSMDKTVFDEMTVHSRIQTSRTSGVQAFGLDPARDYVRAVTGVPANERLGKVVSGSDSLQFSTDVSFDGLDDLCSFLYEKYHDKSYRENFEWYDNLQLVHDPAQVSRLDARLIEAINSRDGNRFHLAPPEIINWDVTGGFFFTPKGGRNERLQLTDYFTYLGDREVGSAEALKRQRVYVWNLENTDSYARWRLYGCVVFETEIDGDRYILTVGNWFHLNRDFAGLVTEYVSRIGNSTVALPCHMPREKEGEDNERVGRTVRNMICLDRKPVESHTHLNKVEICDLLLASGQLIHVKPWHSSSTLSHLFSQARVSAELLLSDEGFRHKVRQKIQSLSPGYVDVIPQADYNPSQIEIVLAIIDSDRRELDERLPFFSKLNMTQATRFLNTLGYKVTKLKVVEVA